MNRREAEIQGLREYLEEAADQCGEIFLLLIGDLGGGTFKLILQDLTEVKPNSPFSGFLVGEMDAGDSYDNLKAAFGDFQVGGLSFTFFFIRAEGPH